ncbi:MAG: ImmA/IrrE family metallo-endopeptidase [Rhodobacteraceae bacterium]|nr:ImmA/IrrE family metallo-endopeptidase [Paracoccaceae bacterium]
MRSREFKNLEDPIRAIIDRHTRKYPVKVGQLAKDLAAHLGLGMSVKMCRMKMGFSGQISRDETGGYTIRVDRDEARRRQRFTIAHELAHFLLHRQLIDSSTEGIMDNVLYRSGAPERIEYEANRLAADIVMPMDLIRQILQEEFGGLVTEETTQILAQRFQVSQAAMEIRLSRFAEA